MISLVRSFTVAPMGEVMRSTSVCVVLFTIDGVLKPTVGSNASAEVDGNGVEGIKVGTSLESSALSAAARTTLSFSSVFSSEESASVSDGFFPR